jgi:hypothetical protein
MSNSNKISTWVIISFVLNLLFGSSFILGYLKYKYEVENMNKEITLKEQINRVEKDKILVQMKTLEAEARKYDMETDRTSAQKVEITTNLRDRVGAKLYEIIKLTEEYLDVIELNKKNPSPAFSNKVNQLRQRLDLLKTDFTDLEKQLSGLEKRDVRKININFIPPAPPMNLRIE